ncbi:glycoside hydrolase family 16 protein [Winogradskyella echinorum]|uniref:Glycoside hydrolase family 16 protein n=1 Tax=Winogradskyella echinorum TaxID=538189 RepID=A0ABR6Y563_9FLAO|nr:glycoside hydrolase family 16 protein [Winogradskyella echinorum]MBC3847398.1 glycoside hydrolase family 16 protein [Winogradskyella echinorum]MBC5751746.1 glycoside hydrolase family 16 protein [Winogradskyella echinorum]
MKNLKYIIYSLLTMFLVVTSCQEDDADFGEVVAPSNIQITVDIVGADANNPNGDGSGVVNFTTTATNAISYQYVYNGSRTSAPNGEQSYNFANLGLNTYSVTVIAFGTGGASTSETIDVDVLSLYEPPADLITMLTADSSRTWRIKSETGSHFGLGPVGGGFNEWYQASAEEKAGVGMYDDRYIFNVDGTFTHITNSTNDDGGVNTDGTVFGREVLIDELNGTGGPGTANGADIENYPYSDYTAQWSLSAPGGVETLSLSGIAFLGYYIGGDHTYKIEMRSANEMSVRSTDGNGEFDWGFILTSEEGGNVVDYELVWSDEFNTDGAPDAANWTYDLGAGGWGNGEVQTYTSNAENVIVEGGVLKITAKADGSGGYTSARIKSQGLQQFTYGKIEISAKLPSAEGTWPALWMLGSNFPTVGWPQSGEMDIMEQTGWDKGTTLGTCHWFDNGTNANASYGETTAVANASTEFHLYSIEWDETSIKISLDEVPYMTLANNPDLPFNADFFFIMNIAMGGTLGGTINPAFTEDTMEVDYIRVYQ